MNDIDNAPYGKEETVMTHWGKEETANIFVVRDWAGISKYAVISRPRSNKHVRCSVFKVDS